MAFTSSLVVSKNPFLFKRIIGGNLSKNGDHLVSSFYHRIKVGESLIYIDDNYSIAKVSQGRLVVGSKIKQNIEEMVYFRGRSSKFERFCTSYLFNTSGTYVFEITKRDAISSCRGGGSDHDCRIRVTVNVIE